MSSPRRAQKLTNRSIALPDWAYSKPAIALHNNHLGCRIALYSHDTMGIGHVRRNLLIAQSLARYHSRTSILLIAGARETAAFALPPGVDCLTLPALSKCPNGQYEARQLGIALKELVKLRARAIVAALESFEPDVLIVDKVPRGALRELESVLPELRARVGTRCVLGLRDVLDDPAAVRREWDQLENEQAIRDYYDAVWVYGDPRLYDLIKECHFSSHVEAKVCYTGYFDQRQRLRCLTDPCEDPREGLGLPPGRLVLGMMGGGQDGAELAEAFVRADLPPETNGVLICGPYMPPDVQSHLHQLAAGRRRFRVLDFISEPDLLLRHADRVVAMGGYNTVSEVLSFEKQALLVPRVIPRREQLIRVERLHELGLVDMLHPDDVTPTALSAWLANKSQAQPRNFRRLNLDGLTKVRCLLEELLAGARRPVVSARDK